MPSTKTISRSALLNMTLVIEALILLAATFWSQFSDVPLAKSLTLNYKAILIGSGSGVLMALSAYLLYRLSLGGKCLVQLKDTIDTYMIPLVSELTTRDIVAIALVSGFCEEIFFRGVAQAQFGLVLTSIAFGLFHDPSFRNLSYSLLACAYGLVLGAIYIYTGNLWAPILAHVVHNLISLLLLRYVVKPPSPTAQEQQ